MPLKSLRKRIKSTALSPAYGMIQSINANAIVATGLKVSIGQSVTILAGDERRLGMVTSLGAESFTITPFGFIEGMKVGDRVLLNRRSLDIPVGEKLLGRVVDPFMNPIDGKGAIHLDDYEPIMKSPMDAMKRGLIDEHFSVGIKSIDGLLTSGKGQKVGIFAGSGVGKSTLMGMIVKGSEATIKVVALIGERGREVPEFIAKNLGNDLTNTVIVVATSDDSALMRKYGAFSAMSVAEYFKRKGHDVLFMMDSVTRFAMAQREIGLALGEPPTSKGYPPSSLTLLPQLMERAGKEDGQGSITAFFTVLVEGDDLSDPIADQSRSILDGHIVLSRELTDRGIYPPVDILSSASRVIDDVTTPEHLAAARKFRHLLALLKENEMLVRIGAYQRGTDPQLDEALAKKERMEDFLRQSAQEVLPFDQTVEMLKEVVS
ncbi:flagellar protein export ATPase FliI [Hydrogenimonas cancrithermarum]|uniref:Flagellum-specific ATP synthase n=1 Tax=Hydrogenimonas cancrithermarum TaxID=2993563 RepID=A0ABM8FKP6_9BACT|nr:flagellar protein export ATPase FliI [Hydrogenimonas cancrithermarum]BDY12892.1 flagellum-specific ATP synthase [Hydrogenimonas cancrithermarum]BDY13009.1 flagellum-specific ATP synthase [Hydrogenimonas cancrithermarum]